MKEADDISQNHSIKNNIAAIDFLEKYPYTMTNNIDIGASTDTAFTVYGRDILKELDEMRDALLLLKRDLDMEAKYPRLKELKDEYEAALEKYKTFETIKDSK
jgi:TRAP-type mannitol/chloroaromatic compound transport system substrate-binding protein